MSEFKYFGQSKTIPSPKYQPKLVRDRPQKKKRLLIDFKISVLFQRDVTYSHDDGCETSDVMTHAKK